MATLSPGTRINQRVDNTHDDPRRRAPLVLGGKDFMGVTDAVVYRTERRPHLIWWICFLISASFAGLFFGLIGYLFATGVGVWGNNQPVAWGFPIVNFVFWVGIGHAGTLISAVLFLFRQNWRTSINRFAEAMTIFAVVCAGIFPGIHVGRPWLAYWLFPYPNQMAMWPQFRSPLLWDVFAVSTYASVSLLFWYTGMVPDLATLRDRCKDRIGQIAYGIASLGWNGSSRHWHRFERAYILLAALCTPLVLVGPLGGVLRLCGGPASGLAHDRVPALLRGRGDLRRLRDGADPRGALPHLVRPQRHHHRPPHRQLLQGHARHRLHRDLRLLPRILHRLVLRPPLRAVCLPQPAFRQRTGRLPVDDGCSTA